jgi:hypothetical protein
MQPKPIKTTYKGVEVIYAEQDDRWLFTIDGRDRSAETLTNAKCAIDAPPPANKRPFKKIEAYKRKPSYSHSDGFEAVVITGIAESKYGTKYAWVSNPTGRQKREKVALSELYARTTANGETIKALLASQQEIDKLQERHARFVIFPTC